METIDSSVKQNRLHLKIEDHIESSNHKNNDINDNEGESCIIFKRNEDEDNDDNISDILSDISTSYNGDKHLIHKSNFLDSINTNSTHDSINSNVNINNDKKDKNNK